MQKHKGSCHCGQIQYEVNMDIKNAIECNCSMCSRKGTILAFATPEQFNLISGEEHLSDYQFYKKALHHTFCKNCGVTPFASGKSPQGKLMTAINVRCLENFDLKSIEITPVDGKSF